MPRGQSKDGSPNRGWFRAGDPKLAIKTPEHRARIAEGQRRAWRTKRKRMPIGSKWIDAGGYVRVKIAEGKGRWRLEHVMVMERRIGRPIARGEIVHHIDGNRSNNADSNLHLCQNHSEHMWLEKQIKGLFREMLQRGHVTFNTRKGIYECH